MFKVPQPGRPLEISALVLRSCGSLVLLSAESGGVHDVSGHVLVPAGMNVHLPVILIIFDQGYKGV